MGELKREEGRRKYWRWDVGKRSTAEKTDVPVLSKMISHTFLTKYTDTCSLHQITGKTAVEIGFNTHHTPPQDQREVKETTQTHNLTQTPSPHLKYMSIHYWNQHFQNNHCSNMVFLIFSFVEYSCSYVVIKCMACQWSVHAVLRVWTAQYSYVLKCVYVSVNFIQWEKQSIKHLAKYENHGAASGRMRDPYTHTYTSCSSHLLIGMQSREVKNYVLLS